MAEQTLVSKGASQVGAGAVAAWIVYTFVPAEHQAIAGPAFMAAFSWLGKLARNVLTEFGWAKFLP